MEVIRECWNAGVSASEFVARARGMGDVKVVAGALAQVVECADGGFYRYACAMFDDDTRLVCDVLNGGNDRAVNGVMWYLGERGMEFVEGLEPNCAESAEVVVRVLKECLRRKDEVAEKVVRAMSRSPLFPVVVASMMCLAPEGYEAVRSGFLEFLEERKIVDKFFYPHELLMLALDNRKVRFPQGFYTAKDCFYYLLSNIHQLMSTDTKTPFMGEQLFGVYLFVHILQQFLTTPTYSLAYLTISLPSRLFTKTETSPDCLTQMMDAVFDSLEDPASTFELKYPMDKATIIDILNKCPPDIDDGMMMAACRRHPVLISSVIPRIQTIFRQNNFQNAVMLAKEMLEHLDDFVTILIMTNTFIPFIHDLLKLLCRIKTSWESFEPLMTLFAAMLRKTWVSGAAIRRKAGLDFVSQIEDEKTRFFCHYLLTCSTKEQAPAFPENLDICDRWNKRDPPFGQVEDLFVHLLVRKCYDWRRLGNALTARPFLWMPVMMWAIVDKAKKVQDLIHIPRYQDPLFDDMFMVMMMRIVDRPQSWMSIVGFPDYDVKKMYPPPSPHAIVRFLHQHIVDIALTNLERTTVKNVSICWRAWIEIFGLKAFINVLLDFLDKYVLENPTSDRLLDFYKISAFLILSANNAGTDELVPIFVERIATLMDRRTALYFAWFVIINISGRVERVHENFEKIGSICETTLKTSFDANLPEVAFALCFMSLALHVPTLRTCINRDIVSCFTKFSDWKSAIDFYRVFQPNDEPPPIFSDDLLFVS